MRTRILILATCLFTATACSRSGSEPVGAPDVAADASQIDAGPRDMATVDAGVDSDAVIDVRDTAEDAPDSSDGGEDLDPSFRYEITDFAENAWTWDQALDRCGFSNNGLFWNWVLHGREPSPDGKYPVFLYFHGTGDVGDGPAQLAAVESMAARGFVAASVTYDSLGGLGAVLEDPDAFCPILDKKLGCIFGDEDEAPITKICARPKADCDSGIVVAGHSQGSALSVRAQNFDPRVRAAYGLGAGLHVELDVLGTVVTADTTSCLAPLNRALPVERLRIVNGESEYTYGDQLFADLRTLTGSDCPDGEPTCLRPGGSGYALFPDAANEDGRGLSQHCYMANMPGGDCTVSTGLNSTWTDGAQPYALESSLDWLRRFVD